MDPAVTDAQVRFGLIEDIPGLNIIHDDGRAYLARTDKIYDAIIVGGGAVSQEWADEIGSDGYSPDAAGAVDLCKMLLKK